MKEFLVFYIMSSILVWLCRRHKNSDDVSKEEHVVFYLGLKFSNKTDIQYFLRLTLSTANNYSSGQPGHYLATIKSTWYNEQSGRIVYKVLYCGSVIEESLISDIESNLNGSFYKCILYFCPGRDSSSSWWPFWNSSRMPSTESSLELLIADVIYFVLPNAITSLVGFKQSILPR